MFVKQPSPTASPRKNFSKELPNSNNSESILELQSLSDLGKSFPARSNIQARQNTQVKQNNQIKPFAQAKQQFGRQKESFNQAKQPFIQGKSFGQTKAFVQAKPFTQAKPFAQAKQQFGSKPAYKPTLTPAVAQNLVPVSGGSSLKIIPLGGQEEVGRNCTVFEYDNDIVILDMGLQFADEDMPGIDYIIPNTAYLKGKERNIRGVIFSHGHLDHIGAAPIMLEQLGNPPIIGRKLTLAMIKHRQEDYKKGTTKSLKTIMIDSINHKLTLGKFQISFFQVEHSIIDAIGVIISTPHGTVIHPGDWTIDADPQGNTVGYEHLAKLPSPRILMLESLGVSYSKEKIPVKTTQANLERLLAEAKGRVIIGTFASQLERITHLLAYAEKIGKKVALDGYGMKMNVKIAQELGYIPAHKNTLISVEDIHKYPENKILVICTGAQGEANAVFARIVNGNHRFITIKKSDIVIFSSSVIPGNERSVQKVKDQLYRLSDNVIHSSIMDVHSGGHANADDIKNILHQIKPDYFLPVYANHYMLVETKKLALREGFKEDQISVLDNGSIIKFQKNKKPIVLKEKANTDYVMVDGLGIGDVSEIVLRDRRMMADDGMIVVIATIDAKTGAIIGNPDLISRGFVHMKENRDLIEKTRAKVKKIVKDKNPMSAADDDYIKNKIRNEIGQFLFQATQRRPMVLPVVIKV